MNDDFEEKKWVMEKIDDNFRTILHFKEKVDNELKEFSEMEIKKFTDIEKGILSISVFLITLSIGLISISVDWINIETMLYFVFLLGAPVYAIVSIFKYFNRKRLDNVLNQIHKGESKIHYPKGYLLQRSTDLDTHSVDDLRTFFNYLTFVIEPALNIQGYFAVKDIQKSIWVSKNTKKVFRAWEVYYKNHIDDGIKHYEDEQKIYDASVLCKNMSGFPKVLLEVKKGNHPNMENVFK